MGFKNIYDEIIIISPTFMLQPIWTQIKPDGVKVYLQFKHETMEQIMASQTENHDRAILLILDDLGEDVLRCKNATQTFHKLIANSRHLNISIIWLCQKLTQCPTYCRANCDVFISFASLSTRERDALYNEVSMTDKHTFQTMFTDNTKDRFSTFAATFRDGKLNYYSNLEKKIDNQHGTNSTS